MDSKKIKILGIVGVVLVLMIILSFVLLKPGTLGKDGDSGKDDIPNISKAGKDDPVIKDAVPLDKWNEKHRDYIFKKYPDVKSTKDYLSVADGKEPPRYYIRTEPEDSFSFQNIDMATQALNQSYEPNEKTEKTRNAVLEAVKKAKDGDKVTIDEDIILEQEEIKGPSSDVKVKGVLKKSPVIEEVLKKEGTIVKFDYIGFEDIEKGEAKLNVYAQVKPAQYPKVYFQGCRFLNKNILEKAESQETKSPPSDFKDVQKKDNSYKKPVPLKTWVRFDEPPKSRAFGLTDEDKKKIGDNPEDKLLMKGDFPYIRQDYYVRVNKVIPYSKDPKQIVDLIKKSQTVNTADDRPVVQFKDLDIPSEVEPVLVEYEVYVPEYREPNNGRDFSVGFSLPTEIIWKDKHKNVSDELTKEAYGEEYAKKEKKREYDKAVKKD